MLYIYNENKKLSGVVESFEYLRWVRRYTRAGAFELIAIATPQNISLLKEGNLVWKNSGSPRDFSRVGCSDDEEAGFIERVELSQAEREVIIVSGRFATSMLGRRIIWGTETLKGDISVAVSQLITRHFLSPIDDNRKITGFSYSAPNFGKNVSTQTSYRNLLETICDLCDTADVGLKTVFDPKTGLFTIKLYPGGNSSAVFSKEYENVTGQTYIESVSEYANSALIGGEGEGADRQFATIIQGTGANRREIFVDARDLQAEDFPGNYIETLTFRGQSRLAELVPRYSFDAEVNPHGNLRYKTDFDIGNSVKVIAEPWGVSMTARITEIVEIYDSDGLSLLLTFGKSELTLAQKMRSDMSDLQTSAMTSSGGWKEIPDSSVTAAKLADNAVTSGKIESGAVTSAKVGTGAVVTAGLADGAVTLAKINAAALPSTSNTYTQRLITDTYKDAGAVNLNEYLTAGEYTLYNVTTATNFPTGTWTGTGNTPHLIVQRYYSASSVRQILTKRNSPNDIWTRTASSATAWTAWYKIPAFGDGGEVATVNIANAAVTTAKMAQEASTSMSVTWGSGVSLAATNNSYVNKGVVCLGFQIQLTSTVAPNGILFTIASTAFRPYTTVRSVLVPVPTFVTNAPMTIDSGGVARNAASGTTLPTGYYMVSVTYARA